MENLGGGEKEEEERPRRIVGDGREEKGIPKAAVRAPGGTTVWKLVESNFVEKSKRDLSTERFFVT